MSSWSVASTAPMSIVIDATIATTSSAAPAASYIGNIRATRYIPATTIVAAWISAETGVGPAIASGSQT